MHVQMNIKFVKLNLYYLLLGLLSHSSFIVTLQAYFILAYSVEKVMLNQVRNKQTHKNAIAANQTIAQGCDPSAYCCCCDLHKIPHFLRCKPLVILKDLHLHTNI